MRFSRLRIQSWRQFRTIDIEFHDRITVITGANGAGKSTLIRILAQHFGWNYPLLSTPKITSSGVMEYFTGLRDFFLGPEYQSAPYVGTLTYSNGKSSRIHVPSQSTVTYNVQLTEMQPVLGLSINSHRPVSSYQQVTSIPTNALSAEQAYQTYSQEMMNKYNNSYTQYGPVYRMKEAIISMAMFGEGNNNVEKIPGLGEIYQNFKDVLRQVLPENIGFRDVTVRIPDVVIVTDSGEFVIDAASGGLMSLIELAWQIFLYSYNKDRFTILLDEPENHLHPSMQRRIVGDLVRAFPNAQFVVVTHSPFVVSSVRDSFVYVLRHEDDGGGENPTSSRSVSSIKLEHANKAGTAGEILRDVLGVPVTLPEWAEGDLRAIAGQYTADDLVGDGIARLRADLTSAGLGEYYPEALSDIVARS